MRHMLDVVFLSILLVIPVAYPSLAFSVPQNTIAQTEQPTLERIYGELVIDEIYEAITSSELMEIVREFTQNGSRFINGVFEADSGANLIAREYVIEHLEELTNGRIEIEIIGDYNNVIGRLPGYLPGEHPAFVVSAHYDSPEGSPGANCNGGGIAAMLTLARVMGQYEWPLDIYFMAFNGLPHHGPELQQFMEGSQEVATELRYRGFETLALFNIDTIMYPHPNAASDEQVQMGYNVLSGYTDSQYWAELTRTISNNYGFNTIVPVPSNYFYLWPRSDHFAFTQRGYSGVVCAFQSGYQVDAFYHTGFDNWDSPGYRYSLVKDVTAAIGGSMSYVMGRTYGEPRRFDFSFTTRSEATERLYIPISTPTDIVVTCRWFGGPATFSLLDPNGVAIGTAIYDDASAWEYTDLFNIPVSQLGLYTLQLYNPGHQSVGFELTYSYSSDIDGNSVPDRQEFWLDSVYFSTDLDSDELSAAEEIFLGTDDTMVDSDLDTLPDKFEVDNGLDPTDPVDGTGDEDMDGLSNAQEFALGLDLFSADSDNDLMPDLWELENGLNPLFDDSLLDFDGDGKSNLQEYLEESDPQREEEEDSIPVLLYVVPIIIIAPIAGFLYLGRDSFR
ncbi:MAG: M28 family metallopeptidase [Candidatus Thorarchaeota archaeon]